MKRMPLINRVLFAILLVYGTYLTLVDGPSPHSIILILVGISQLAIEFVFPSADTYDERQEAIKMKSGQVSYALSILYVFAVVMLVQWGIIEDVLTALLCVLFIQVMTFPVTLFMYSRRS
ncbi:hypothetical protein HNY42_08540 [Exiguobacterium sp. Helios]|uniref:hypothetical protein n=1 Tax=unclassified Exiguobacterium TaxID=2644629 RepID=UPI001039A1A9|nr:MULTISPECIES: hypothetical protein [unclassified Exiguobacterium]QNR20980.1 hypothetical protein HNY42_08540 [Exiguobacterium sp. Helios]